MTKTSREIAGATPWLLVRGFPATKNDAGHDIADHPAEVKARTNVALCRYVRDRRS